jgi:hypothetical protein
MLTDKFWESIKICIYSVHLSSFQFPVSMMDIRQRAKIEVAALVSDFQIIICSF